MSPTTTTTQKVKNIPIEKYHGDTSRISKSGLDKIHRSPAHYFTEYLDPNRDERIITEAFRVGGAIHVSVLEPEDFGDRYVVSPDINKRSKAGKEEWEEFQETHAGKTILTVKDYDTAMFARDAVRSHELARDLISKGWAEKVFHWKDPETGAPCKCRPDFLNVDDYVIDVKSTEDARAREFGRSALKFRYDVAASFYKDGILHARGKPAKAFVLIAVEKSKPYNVAVYYFTTEQVNAAREKYLKDLKTYMECIKSKTWPGYPPEAGPVLLPNWAQ